MSHNSSDLVATEAATLWNSICFSITVKSSTKQGLPRMYMKTFWIPFITIKFTAIIKYKIGALEDFSFTWQLDSDLPEHICFSFKFKFSRKKTTQALWVEVV